MRVVRQLSVCVQLVEMMVVTDTVMSDSQVKDSLSDEDYLITRARQAWKAGKIHEAKTWMLTARSIFPDNFGIQLEAYVSEKDGGNVKESAKYFQKLFEKFPKEEKLLAEIQVVMEVLKKPNPDGESLEGFYLEMFEELPDETKKKLIVCAAEAAKDSFEYSKLMIVLMKKFNSEIANYGEKLIESINNAETKEFGSSPDPLNQYRTILVTEILPTVLKAEKLKINSKLVLSNLQKAQEFVLASSLKKGGRVDSPWLLLYNIVHCVGRQLGWPGNSRGSIETLQVIFPPQLCPRWPPTAPASPCLSTSPSSPAPRCSRSWPWWSSTPSRSTPPSARRATP